jgi:nucleoside-diphosphate-sugar epimerase
MPSSNHWKQKTVLVIGGAGNLGNACVQALHGKGAVCKSFDLEECRMVGVESVQGDVRDAAALEAAMMGVDVVFHTVALIDIR